MCNIAAHGDSFCTTLLDKGALKEIIPLFRSTDTDTVHYALSFCEMLLHSSPDVSIIHPFNGPLSGTTQVSRYQEGQTNLAFTEARDSECQWHQLGHMQVCSLPQTDNHTSTHHSVFLQARCRSCHPTKSVKALKA